MAPGFGELLEEALSKAPADFGLLSLYTGDMARGSGAVEFAPRSPSDRSNFHFGFSGQAVALLYRRAVVPGLARHLLANFMEAPLDQDEQLRVQGFTA